MLLLGSFSASCNRELHEDIQQQGPIGFASCAELVNSTAAFRAFSGHSPPAMSARANNGSQISHARSFNPFGIVG